MASISCSIKPDSARERCARGLVTRSETFEAALSSAHSAGSATQLVLEGEPVAYALCRPPGHHAFKDMSGVFWYINNSAVAAQRLRSRYDRVAIIDVDLHHGNGTQDIFYDRSDVFTASIHADPVDFYPFHWGYANERGRGQGVGYNLNVPLPGYHSTGRSAAIFIRSYGNAAIRALNELSLPFFKDPQLDLDAPLLTHRGELSLCLHGQEADFEASLSDNPSLKEITAQQALEYVPVGRQLKAQLLELQQRYSMVGDVRGEGLLLAMEFVQNQATKAPFPAALNVFSLITAEAKAQGLLVYPRRCLDGIKGDHILITPPLILDDETRNEIVRKLDLALNNTQRVLDTY